MSMVYSPLLATFTHSEFGKAHLYRSVRYWALTCVNMKHKLSLTLQTTDTQYSFTVKHLSNRQNKPLDE